MLSLPDLAIVGKLFYKNGESATKALRLFRTLKGIKAKKIPISLKRILNAVHRFEETRRWEHRPRSGRTSVSANRVPVVQSVMRNVTAETSMGSCSAPEAGKVTGIPDRYIRRIHHVILKMHPYKIDALHQLLPADCDKKQAFAKWALA